MKKPEMIYKRTGLFIDWDQLESLPEIDTLLILELEQGGHLSFMKYLKIKD